MKSLAVMRLAPLVATVVLTIAFGPRCRAASGAVLPPRPLYLGAMIQPLAERNVFKLPDYFGWCPHLPKGEDGVPRVLTLAIAAETDWDCVTLPLAAGR